MLLLGELIQVTSADDPFAKERQAAISNFKTDRKGGPLECLKGDFIRINGE